ncbi:MAG: hypothetical protein ACJ8AT_38685 [Hyalangium sp.]|uniref:hypothetical protein n=1 Tax=Hyalangium sp. TaxID=2028555 RepID=UPI00389AE2C7
MSTPKKPILEPLRVRIRRAQFIVGLGFLALVMGSVLAGDLSVRLSVRLESLPFQGLVYVIGLAVRNLWVLAVLPLLCYGAARVLELRPWSTALGAALTGQAFLLAVEFVRNGVEGWVDRGWLATALEWGVLGVGVVLSQRAVVRGRAAAGKQTERAQQQAAARKDEYAEFLQEAERAGEKLAQREQSLPSPEQAVAPAAPGAETPEQKSEDVPKAPAA